jgi:BirA family biotin operon repressor/biotin-[acetyl-CoA-carboxylase] ligase
LLIDSLATGIAPASWPLLSLASAVAVCDALATEFDAVAIERIASDPRSTDCNSPPQIAIKWPNDVLAVGGKVCGILIESPGGGVPAKDRVIIGIGINVNNSCQNVRRGTAPYGTAICDITGKQHDLQGLISYGTKK